MLDYDPSNYDFEEEVSLEPDEKNVAGDKTEWLKFTKPKEKIVGSIVYFNTYDVNTIRRALKMAKKTGKELPGDMLNKIGSDALTKRAEELKKEVSALTNVEKLDLSAIHFKVIKSHYSEETGSIISRLGKDGPEADAVWERLPVPRKHFTTLVLVYPIDKTTGEIDKDVLKSQLKGKRLDIRPWKFAGKTYDEIWGLNSGLRANKILLSSQDIEIVCDNVKFQNVKITTAGPAVWRQNETLKQIVLENALKMYDKLVPYREISTDELKEKLGISSSADEMDLKDEGLGAEGFEDLLDAV